MEDKTHSSDLITAELRALRVKEKYLSVLNNFAILLLKQNTLSEITWAITKNVISKLQFEDCVVYLLDPKKQILIQKAAHGNKNPSGYNIKDEITIPLGIGIVGHVARTGKSEIINDTSKDPRYIVDDNSRLSEIAVPIISDDRVIGVIDSENSQKNFFTNSHLELLTSIAAMAANRISHALSVEKLKEHKATLEIQVQKRTEELQNAVHNLKRSNKDLEHYAHAVSHDLKEPTRTIINSLRLLEMSTKDLSEKAKEYIQFSLSSASRMSQLMDDLLAYSKIDGIKEPHQRVDLNKVINEIKIDFSSAINEANAKINFQTLPLIEGHPILIRQIFQNLIANAIKFRDPNRLPEIDIIVVENIDNNKIMISDNGIGIHKDYHETIFELFSRLHNKNEYEGSGLGLSFCKKVAEIHGWKISVESNSPKPGSNFIIEIPKESEN